MNSQTKNCQNCKREFIIEPDDFTFYEKMRVPPPTFCHLCRAQRRFAWRNEWVIYPGVSFLTGKPIMQSYAPEVGVKVIEREKYYTDDWDPMDYGFTYDFTQPFFSQFKKLLYSVPLKNLDVLNGVNSDYTNNLTDPKNCFLTFNGSNPEDCRYSNGINFCRDSMDISHSSKSETCYESFWLNNCNKCLFCSECDSCFEMYFSKNCVGCNNCFGCVGLRNKSYYIFNEPYSKEEYEKKIESFNLASRTSLSEMKSRVREFWSAFPKRYIEGYKNENVTGSYIDRCKNVKDSFLVRESRDLRFCQYVQELPGSTDCYDYSVWGDRNERVYECHSSGIGLYNVKFSVFAKEDIRDVEYTYACTSCSDCFGCVGLKKKQYCIFNVQYSKDEYFDLVEKIKKQMDELPYTDNTGCVYTYGEFFPIELSPFPYNQTLAQEYFHLSKETVEEKGYRFIADRKRDYAITLTSDNLPDTLLDIPDSIVDDVIECAHKGECEDLCTKAFKVLPDDLVFYRKMNLPIPTLCSYCRSFDRLSQRNGMINNTRTCDCDGKQSAHGKYQNSAPHMHGDAPCDVSFITSYKDMETVYCEKCYQSEFS